MKATRTRRQPKGKEKEKIGENGKLMTQALFVHKYSHRQATASAPVVRLQNLSQNDGQRKGICKVKGPMHGPPAALSSALRGLGVVFVWLPQHDDPYE